MQQIGATPTEKRCTRCKLTKPLDQFYACAPRYGQLKRRPWCKGCYSVYSAERRPKVRDRLNAQGAAWKKRNPDKVWAQQLNSKYAMSPAMYEYLMYEQMGGCAVCETPFGDSTLERPHIEHNHETGVVRGLVHGRCNLLIGIAKEDTHVLQKAIEYLRRHGK